jgi:PAS domain S-box-containing protein
MNHKWCESFPFYQAGKPEQNYGELLNELPVGIISCKTDGTVTSVNSFLVKLLGSPSADATKQINALTFPPLMKAGISAAIQEVINTGKTSLLEAPYRSRWNKDLFLRLKIIPYKDGSEKVIGCHAIVEDITATEEKKIEIEHKTRTDALISDISSSFINSSFKNIDFEIYRSLEKLTRFIGAERIVIFELTESNEFLIKTHEWHIEDLVSHIGIKEKIPAHKFISKQLQNLQTVRIKDVQQMPDENSQLHDSLKEVGILSVVMVPMLYKETLRGFIAVDSKTEKKEWDDSTVYMIKLIGEMITNVLERKNTEQLLLEKEADFGKVVNSIDTIVWKADVDTKGNFVNTYISASVDKIVGMPQGFIGNNWNKYRDHIHIDDRPKVAEAFQRGFLNPGYSISLDYRLVRDDGDILWVTSNGIAYALEDDTLQVFGSTVNITDRKLAEENLMRNEKKYRSLFEQSNDAIFIHSLDGQILDVNNRACEMLGYTKEDLKQLTIFDLIPSDQREVATKGFNKIRENGSIRIEVEHLKADGSRIVADVSASVLEEHPDIVQAILRDVTDRKRLEESLLQAKVAAETASRTKSEFLANMSHELRTPLNSIIGFSDALIEGYFGELNLKQVRYIQNVSTSGRHLLNLINDILDISKVEAGKMKLFPECIHVDYILEEMVALVQPIAAKKEIRINVVRDPKLETLLADKAKIKQILYNLLGNAIKFTHDGGSVTIHAHINDDMARFSIIDTGIGIAPEDMKKLFRPFTQLDASVARRYEGTGLGLALVRELIELHGGHIWVESEVGKGSNFTFELPICITE